MKTEDKSCETCQYMMRFKPRKDEIERGFTHGCKKPNYEGYCKDGEMSCGGVFWAKAEEQKKTELHED